MVSRTALTGQGNGHLQKKWPSFKNTLEKTGTYEREKGCVHGRNKDRTEFTIWSSSYRAHFYCYIYLWTARPPRSTTRNQGYPTCCLLPPLDPSPNLIDLSSRRNLESEQFHHRNYLLLTQSLNYDCNFICLWKILLYTLTLLLSYNTFFYTF